MNVVIVNEQCSELGGTERVLMALLDRFPDAVTIAPRFAGDARTLMPAPTHSIPIRGRRRHYLAPLYARRVARQRIEPPALVISLASQGWGQAATVPSGARHVCYSAGVPRALYDQSEHYLRAYPLPARPLIRTALPALKANDRRLMTGVDRLLTNSRFSAERLEQVHGRRAEVIPPPVKTAFFTPAPRERTHFLIVARLRPQKQIGAVIDAFRGKDEQLVIAGTGPWLDRLRRSAPVNVRFTGYVEDDQLRELYRSSHALVCPSVEEFGIVVAEAQAAGTPVVARAAGAAREIVRTPRTGLLIDSTSPQAIAAAVSEIRSRHWDPHVCRQAAVRFDEEVFGSAFERVVAEELDGSEREPQAATAAVA